MPGTAGKAEGEVCPSNRSGLRALLLHSPPRVAHTELGGRAAAEAFKELYRTHSARISFDQHAEPVM